jgi:hypothetical protein
MFHITVLCERRAERAVTRLAAACFGVHFFAGNSIVNSALHCWVLDGECGRLWKSPSARLNTLFTVAPRACAITRSRLFQFEENILLPSARYGVDANVGRPPRTVEWEFVPRGLSRWLDAFCSKGQAADLKNLEKDI